MQEPEILEKGLIYFFYRPKIGVDKVTGLEDVQRLYILLWPAAPPIQEDIKKMEKEAGKTDTNQPERLLVIGKKKLPEVSNNQHGKYWGFVKKVTSNILEMDKDLAPEDYDTLTRGQRHVEGARPVGEGVYALVQYHNQTHLAYVLELPEEPGEVQKTFNIGKEGSYVIQIKNPEAGGSFLKSGNKVKYPESLQKLFKSKLDPNQETKFHSAKPVDLLDHEGVEMILIGASDDLPKEFGETGKYLEELEQIDARKIDDDKLWRELHLAKSTDLSLPLLQGKWN